MKNRTLVTKIIRPNSKQKGMKAETKNPDLEIRRFETIYKTFLKMNSDQRKRALQFMIDKFHSDNKNKKQ